MNNRKIALSAMISEGVFIGENVIIGENVTICAGTVIGNNVILKDNVYIDHYVIIRDHVTVGENTTVGARCILGEYLMDFYKDRKNKVHPLVIGSDSLIRSETIIYGENTFGKALQTGHRVTIRERSKIGSNVRIGTLSDIQGNCTIEDYVSIHSNVFVAPNSVIKKYAWLFPCSVLTNDPTPPSMTAKGVTVGEYAAVAAGAVIVPGVSVGKEVLIGAGSVVTKDIPTGKLVVGNPARVRCEANQLLNPETGKPAYPWQYNFDRGMPWKENGYAQWLARQNKQDSSEEDI